METNSRKDIRTILRRLIGQEIVTSLAHFASIKEVKLWGEDRPSDFELIAVELALFKDLTAVGYCRLAQNVRRWLKTTPKSLLHNQRVLRRIFKQWAAKHFVLGSLEDRIAAARKITFKTPVAGVTLWMDSSDFAMTGLRKVCEKISEIVFEFLHFCKILTHVNL